ncbi:unnamed protein product [Sympodiomycopsis kandeliae]
MANFSAYASNFLNRQNDQGGPTDDGGDHRRTTTQGPIISSSHFQFDPLLHSTFGHRSVDLYGSQIDQDGDHFQSSGQQSFDYPNRRAAQLGKSSLINASRYGHGRSARSKLIPLIQDEDDPDRPDSDEEEEELRDQEDYDNDRRWGRGIDVKHLTRASGSGSGSGIEGHHSTSSLGPHSAELFGSDSHQDATPNASYLADTARSLPRADLETGGADHLDPFLVDDDDDESDHRSPQHQHDGKSARPDKQRGQSTDGTSIGKGKGKADDQEVHEEEYPQPNSTRKSTRRHSRGHSANSVARGWLAHSISSSSTSAAAADTTSRAKQYFTRPVRDAYSIYDDENENLSSEEDEEEEGRLISESEASDDEDDQRGALRASASTIHHPSKMSASSFPRRGGASDDFHRRVYANNGSSDDRDGTGQESVVGDKYNYPTSIGSGLASWKPWARGNNPRWKEWKDQSALVMWTLSTVATVILAGGASLGIKSPSAPSSPAMRPSPYYTLTRSLPLLILLSALSLGMALLNLAFLRNLQRLGGGKYLRFLLIVTPTILSLGWIWAFAGSFFYEDEKWSGGVWSTLGLRLISLFPLLCAILFSRLLYLKQRQLGRSLSVLSLSAKILTAHPSLLLLSMVQILTFLALSIPFLTIFIRLFLIGHFSSGPSSGREWITDSRARILAWLTLGTWIWTWAALRGVMRVVVSSTVSHWYFHGPPSKEEDEEEGNVRLFAGQGPKRPLSGPQRVDEEDDDVEEGASAVETSSVIGLGASEAEGQSQAPGAWSNTRKAVEDEEEEDTALSHRNPTARDIVRASFLRATGPSFGTILLAALLLAISRLLILLSILARNLARLLTSPSIPTIFHPLAHLAYLISGTGNVIKGVSDYTLIYAGITGQGFWKSSRRCSRILSRGGVKGLMEGLLISTILSLLTISLSFLAGLSGFLFSAHQLHVPSDAPLVGLLCGIVPYWTLRLGADVLSNGVDTLYLCYAIDSSTTVNDDQEEAEEEGGKGMRNQAREVFTTDPSHAGAQQQHNKFSFF